MVPWYTVEPPPNGLCPKHCRCAEFLIESDVQPCLEGFYERHVLAITEQAERSKATKESLLEYAAPSYWEGKADELKIPYHLMDLSAPLPPCVALIVERQIDGMLEDFSDLEEGFFAFKKAPAHKKQAILDGSEDGSYSATLKKRRDERAIFLALNDTPSAASDPLPLFGPPSKKLKQTTLTQDFNEFPRLELAAPICNQDVIDLTLKPPPSLAGGKLTSFIDLTRTSFKSSVQTPRSQQVVVSPPKAGNLSPDFESPSALDLTFRTTPKHQKKTM